MVTLTLDATSPAATPSLSVPSTPSRSFLRRAHSPHTFHVPVMGSGFTIDSPLAVAKYGISSEMALIDDALIEQVRRFWCEKFDEHYQAITMRDEDFRAKRITAYLNLMQKLVSRQIAQVKAAPFVPGSDITVYYEMLPDDSSLKKDYCAMLEEQDPCKRQQQQEQLRVAVVSGGIDVNIMTKLDRQHYRHGEVLPYQFCDAAAALRGYAQSDLQHSTIVFSAGFNPQLYGYAATFDDFFPYDNGGSCEIKKQICLKVSDFRSALIQGKYLAKHGLWVSEYCVESPLNCGGHAFINDGQLLGPILEEFKLRQDELAEISYGLYQSVLKSSKRFCPSVSPPVRITAQGGVGTHTEHDFLLNYYGLASVGWGTPFLLVPEVTNVDEGHLQKLLAAKQDDVFLSAASPLGVPFWNLYNSASEEARRERIAQGVPGSACVKGFAKLNQEFNGITKRPICRSSRQYQKYKLEELSKMNLPVEQSTALQEEIISKACICHDLAGGATIKKDIDLKATPAICPGPNILNFKKIMTLKEMVNHIYGRCSLLANKERAHMFITELRLQINYLANEVKKASCGLPVRSQQKLVAVRENLSEGIKYYQELTKTKAREMFKEMFAEQQEGFIKSLMDLQRELDELFLGEVGLSVVAEDA